MKKVFALTVLIVMFGIVRAQSVNDVPLNEIDVEYIQIVGTGKLLSNKVNIELDFGQHNRLVGSKDTEVKDERGEKIEFNSMIDALNYFSRNGYEFVTAYTVTRSNQEVYHYLLKKRE